MPPRPSLSRRHYLLICLSLIATLASDAAPTAEPWQQPYTGDDSHGAQVLAHWKFDAGAEDKDSSGKGHDLKLTPNAFNPQGKFGGCLESFAGYQSGRRETDLMHGARTKNGLGLSPQGAFTVELWVQGKADLKERSQAMLIDKKYVSHSDYQIELHVTSKTGLVIAMASLGFGDHSRTFESEPFALEPGTWHHLAFVYDGAGKGSFFRDGTAAGGGLFPTEKGIAPGKHPLCLGERVGSNYPGCPCLIDEVRICAGAREFQRGNIRFDAERLVFVRMEHSPDVTILVRNQERTPLKGAKFTVAFGDTESKSLDVPEIAPGNTFSVPRHLNTTLRPDTYSLRARLEWPDGYAIEDSANIRIISRLPPRMPVVMWGVGGGPKVFDEMKRLREIGFTHFLALDADYDAVWRAGAPVVSPKQNDDLTRRMLDEALAGGLRVAASISPVSYLMDYHRELLRADKSGKPSSRQDIVASDPSLPPYFENVGKSVIQSYGYHPAFDAALVDSEVRDSANISYSPAELAAVRKATGADIPSAVQTKYGVDYKTLKDFPVNRVVPDDYPILKFYRWWWQQGEGWNALHSALNGGLHSTGRDLWTWFDPAVRCPSLSGSGGSVDVLSHWTYSYPDPIRIGLCADQLFAMARANGLNQRVMKMTQLIWYRSQTAPVTDKSRAAGSRLSAWEDHDPEAAYITIAPMHLRECFWCKIARPLSGIMYHGWPSLVPVEGHSSYKYTQPDTQHVLTELLHDVLQPLGPMLLQVPDAKADVAFLQSFASEMFTRKAMYGNGGGWAGDAWHISQYAHLQSEIVFDESIANRGLDSYKVLILPDCDVLPQSVVDKILPWQAKGGIVIGDELLCPAIKPNILLTSYKRLKKADVDKAELLVRADQLRAQLAAKYRSRCAADQPEIISRLREAGDATYIFVANDHREFGNYVGQHGLVMENGLPISGAISLAGESGAVYDLLTHQAVAATTSDRRQSWHIDLPPGGGGIYVRVPKPIEHLQLAAPAEGNRGSTLPLEIRIEDASHSLVNAVLPISLRLEDPNGRPAERTGYYAVREGRLSVPCDIASNDIPGVWTVTAKELAGGKVTRAFVRIR